MKKLLLALLMFVLLGCTSISDTEQFIAYSAKKSNSLKSYKIEYTRNIVSYVNPKESIHMVPASAVIKYKKGENMRLDLIDWLNSTTRFYKVSNRYFVCSLNKTWNCIGLASSQMQEFLAYNVPNPEASIRRQVLEGAIVLGEIKSDTILGRKSKCFSIEVYPERFTQQDWDEYVLGSITNRDNANRFRNMTVWQCLDEETGVKLELILNYKTEIDGEERTVEINMKALEFEPNEEIEDSVFEIENFSS